MTTRLTRWLTTLDNFEAKMAQLPAVRRYGRLTRATGLVLEATGLQLPLGATCVIERQNGSETHEVESAVSYTHLRTLAIICTNQIPVISRIIIF